MNLTRFDPLRELEGLSRGLNRIFGQPLLLERVDEGARFGEWTPAIDVEESDKEYLIKADLPAIQREDVKVGVEDGVLTIEGERKQEKEEKGRKFHRIERSYGKFVRRLAVPTDVDQSQVSAAFKEGVLQVHLPKSATTKPRAVQVPVA